MGYLLKEGLKALCGVNQWSYAVFWKIGCQNPKLLIWGECYYKPASCSGLPAKENPDDFNASWISVEASNPQGGDKVHLLVNKMMMDNHVNIVGEGLVGRVAFTGNHQWILSETYCGDSHPPEVVKEVCQQFSAGMQTVAVIPVLPHGVVQFGSCMTVMENLGFINDVTSLILQLGYVSGALLSPNYEAKEHAPRIGVPVGNLVPVGNFTPGALSFESNVADAPSPFNSFNYVQNTSQRSLSLAEQIQYELQSNGAAFQASNSNPDGIRHQHYHREPRITLPVINGVAKAEVISSNSELWRNQNTSMCMPMSPPGLPSSSPPLSCSTVTGTGQKILSANVMEAPLANSGPMYCSDDGSVARPSVEVKGLCNGGMSIGCVSDSKWEAGGNSDSKHSTSNETKNESLHVLEPSNSNSADCFTSNSSLAYSSDSKLHHMDYKFGQIELHGCKKEMVRNTTQAHDIPPSEFSEHLNMAELIPGFVQDDRIQLPYDDVCVQPELGDDLFDILGADFKNKLFNSGWNSCLNNESAPNMQSWDSKNNLPPKKVAPSELYSASQGNSKSGIFSSAGTDHLLEAVVSKIQPCTKQRMDDNVSCRTTMTNRSSSSAPNTSLPYGRFGVSDHLEGELFGVPKYLAKAGAMSSSSLRTRPSKEESRSYSQGSSIYGSQVSSWMEKDQKAKRSNSASTSKIPDETGKANRKRLKPGENPRPRPKDRQMFQDRVKELREIVPNGAKCSLDALLERTIKHMLFLQSVTKHADKLKQTGESKIFSKDGGLLSKDNFEGGATWAYEVGSQSMVCPIIVEDLNQPRQMLVQMLCEERGLFLEIADIIRGLGLTILKGVMETRNDKIWARFAVEANRDVTRMEIFMSLVRLLEQSSTGISNENPITQQYHQVASVPLTARPRSLQ